MAESGRVDDLLAMTRAHYRAPPAARERVRSELTADGCFGTEGSGLGEADATRRRPEVRVAGVSKPMVGVVAGLTFLAGFWLGGRPLRGPLVSVSPSSAVPSSAEPSSAESSSAVPSSAPPPPSPTQLDIASTVGASAALQAAPPAERANEQKRSAEAASPAKHRAQRQSAINSELALLQRADHALRSGEPELALSFLADLERRHPETQLGEERRAARLMARCARAGHGDDDGRADAQRFLQRRSASVYADRVRELCGLPR